MKSWAAICVSISIRFGSASCSRAILRPPLNTPDPAPRHWHVRISNVTIFFHLGTLIVVSAFGSRKLKVQKFKSSKNKAYPTRTLPNSHTNSVFQLQTLDWIANVTRHNVGRTVRLAFVRCKVWKDQIVALARTKLRKALWLFT